MRLPGGDDVEIDDRKLIDYALSPTHPVGKFKAKLFELRLGLVQADAPTLRDALARAAATSDAIMGADDVWGRRFRIDFLFTFGPRSAIVTSSWIQPSDGGRTRLTSVFIARER